MMHDSRKFNLVDEAWIASEVGSLCSLVDIFSGRAMLGLGGNAMEKIAIIKFLLALAQAAVTPATTDEWRDLGPEGLGQAILAYLRKWHDAFWLYGEKPFLQMPAIRQAEDKPLGALLPHIASGNTTLYQDAQKERHLTDVERARLLLVLSGCAFGGKKTDNAVTLTPGYTGKRNDKGKPASGKAGPWLGYLGYLHHFLYASDVLRLVWLNLLTHEDLERERAFAAIGTPPWEAMPQGEDCSTARALRSSLMGRLAPLSRFVLLTENGAHYSEGLPYPGHKDGWLDTSIAVNYSGKDKKVLWADPAKLPWRNLPALLAFFGEEQGMTSLGITRCLQRAVETEERLGLWIGGIRVSGNAGEQYASGNDDFVESLYFLSVKQLDSHWATCLKQELENVSHLEKVLFAAVRQYERETKTQEKHFTTEASRQFWELCNNKAQILLDNCKNEAVMSILRKQYRQFVKKTYDRVCPQETARQLAAWGKCQPRFGKTTM